MRKHRWPKEGDTNRCADCDVTRRFRTPPAGYQLPVVVEYLVSGVGWTATRPDCATPHQKDLFEMSDPPAAVIVRHRCHAIGCEIPMAPRYLMCRMHWYSLPPAHREEIWRTYRKGQEVDKKPSDAYLTAAREAIAFVARIEGRLPQPTAAPAQSAAAAPSNVVPFSRGSRRPA